MAPLRPAGSGTVLSNAMGAEYCTGGQPGAQSLARASGEWSSAPEALHVHRLAATAVERDMSSVAALCN
jgi:hypothetical protein